MAPGISQRHHATLNATEGAISGWTWNRKNISMLPNAELSGGRPAVQALGRVALQNTGKAPNRNAFSARPLQRDVRRAT